MAFGTPVPFGIVSLCRRDRRHGKPGGLLHLSAAAVVSPATRSRGGLKIFVRGQDFRGS